MRQPCRLILFLWEWWINHNCMNWSYLIWVCITMWRISNCLGIRRYLQLKWIVKKNHIGPYITIAISSLGFLQHYCYFRRDWNTDNIKIQKFHNLLRYWIMISATSILQWITLILFLFYTNHNLPPQQLWKKVVKIVVIRLIDWSTCGQMLE